MAANNDIVISTKNLSKVYKLYKNPKDRLKEALSLSGKIYHKDFYALKDINLEIKRGEVIGIVGKNGSGKSTLLKILSRVLTQTSGEFMVKGKVSSLLELGSGFNPELTGLENVYFYGTILGFSEEKIKDKLQEILDFADIGDFIYQPLKTYSSGMKSRLAFSVAINVDPDILILDEVLAVGDELFRRKCYARMEGFFKGQKTVLFVSHSVSDINQLCTRAILIDKGEAIFEGLAKLVTTQYERYLFVNPEKAISIREEIVQMNNDDSLKFVACRRSSEVSNKIINLNNSAADGKKTSLAQKADNGTKRKEYFSPNLISTSKVISKYYDVDLYEVMILSTDNENVNILVTGESYFLSYRVSFNIQATDVSFGMMIKNEKGMYLSGSSAKNFNANLSDVATKEKYLVKWKFTCNLLKGTYFINVGVTAFNGIERFFLCRAIDAIVFRVDDPDNKLYSGFVYTDQIFSIIRLD